MEPNWKHIKEEIAKKDAPLSTNAWKNMQALLEAETPKKKAHYWWLLAPAFLLLAVPIYWVTQSKVGPEIPNAEMNTTIGVDNTESESTPKGIEKNEDFKDDTTEKSANAVLPKVSEEVVQQKTTENKTATAEIASTNPTVKNPLKNTEATNEIPAVEPTTATKKVETADTRTSDSTVYFYEEELNVTETGIADSTHVIPAEKLLKNNGNKGVWELKVFAGPNYNAPNITYNSVENYSHRDYENATINSVKAGWGFDAGLEISYFLSPHFKLSTGIAYRTIVTNNSMNYAVDDIPVIDSASGKILGYITLPEATTYTNTSQNSFVYIGVPVSLFKEIPLRGRFSLTAEFVNTFNFLLNQNSETINATSLQIESANNDVFNPLLVNYQLRVGLRYQPNKNFVFALEPAYRGTYNNMYNSDYISWKPSDFSLNAAIIIQLIKK